MILTTISFLMIMIYDIFFKFNYSAYVIGLFWGLLDSGLGSHLGIILGFEFEDQSAAANGLLGIFKSIIMAAASFVTGYIFQWQQYFAWFALWYAFGIGTLVLLYKAFPFK